MFINHLTGEKKKMTLVDATYYPTLSKAHRFFHTKRQNEPNGDIIMAYAGYEEIWCRGDPVEMKCPFYLNKQCLHKGSHKTKIECVYGRRKIRRCGRRTFRFPLFVDEYEKKALASPKVSIPPPESLQNYFLIGEWYYFPQKLFLKVRDITSFIYDEKTGNGFLFLHKSRFLIKYIRKMINLPFEKTEIGEIPSEWASDIAKFILHLSIKNPEIYKKLKKVDKQKGISFDDVRQLHTTLRYIPAGETRFFVGDLQSPVKSWDGNTVVFELTNTDEFSRNMNIPLYKTKVDVSTVPDQYTTKVLVKDRSLMKEIIIKDPCAVLDYVVG